MAILNMSKNVEDHWRTTSLKILSHSWPISLSYWIWHGKMHPDTTGCTSWNWGRNLARGSQLNMCEMFVTNSLHIYGLINQSYIINYTHAVVDNPTKWKKKIWRIISLWHEVVEYLVCSYTRQWRTIRSYHMCGMLYRALRPFPSSKYTISDNAH